MYSKKCFKRQIKFIPVPDEKSSFLHEQIKYKNFWYKISGSKIFQFTKYIVLADVNP